MDFLKNLVMVPLIMVCAIAGTVVLLKLIRGFNKGSNHENQGAEK